MIPREILAYFNAHAAADDSPACRCTNPACSPTMTPDERDQAETTGRDLLIAIGLAYNAMSPRQRALANHIGELARMLKSPPPTVVLSDKQTAEFNSAGQANAVVAKPLERYADVIVVNQEMASLGTARVISCSQHYERYLVVVARGG